MGPPIREINHNAGKIGLVESAGLGELRAVGLEALGGRRGGRGEARHIAESIEFVRLARDRLVPVFIFTNEERDDVVYHLPEDVYEETGAGGSFLLVERKLDLWSDDSFETAGLEAWVRGNASVYALKVWNRVVGSAKNELFAAMCKRSMDWPRVFWNTYKEDRAEPSASLANLISDSLRGRMRMDAFEDVYLGGEEGKVSGEELRGLIGETSFRKAAVLPHDEVRSGDLFDAEKKDRYWLTCARTATAFRETAATSERWRCIA